jgi:hypothetical protein
MRTAGVAAAGIVENVVDHISAERWRDLAGTTPGTSRDCLNSLLARLTHALICGTGIARPRPIPEATP